MAVLKRSERGDRKANREDRIISKLKTEKFMN